MIPNIAAHGLDILFQKDAKPFIKTEGGDPLATQLIGPNAPIKPITDAWPGYDYPITFRQIEMRDTTLLSKVMKRSSRLFEDM